MEMRATKPISAFEDLTPPLPPLTFSLYTSFLHTHCSACFSPLPNPPSIPLYCSPQCFLSDSPLRLSSAEPHLLGSHHDDRDTSDLRAALRLLRRFEQLGVLIGLGNEGCGRVGGLMTNRGNLMSSSFRM